MSDKCAFCPEVVSLVKEKKKTTPFLLMLMRGLGPLMEVCDSDSSREVLLNMSMKQDTGGEQHL